ncbi:MAG TPA: ATP-binding protein [Candidatus Dormibacteraeota bacterium]|nr:ATP-binding protein [Candidatus Dormibacteraeota bacterium]
MSKSLPIYPFDDQRSVGTIIEVGPSVAKLNLPHATVPAGQWLHGHRLSAGEVGEYLLIEAGEFAILGRLIGVKLPERERLTVEPELGAQRSAHPLGTMQLLATLSIKDGVVSPGISTYPRLGSKAYSAHPLLLKWIAESSQRGDSPSNPLVLELGLLPSTTDTMVNLTPERLFGRHCALLGATGGGKSWTIARLVEQASATNAKVLLLDATGEFYTLESGVSHVQVGAGKAQPAGCKEVVFPYSELTESDLFALFRPSGQTQGPKLRAAMKSLKLAKLAPALAPAGYIVKTQVQKTSYHAGYAAHAAKLESPSTDFEIKHLTRQIDAECVWPSGGTAAAPDPNRWGNTNEAERSYCVTMITRIEDMLSSQDLACVFQPNGKMSIAKELDDFLSDRARRTLRISLRHLPFGHHAREIVANAIGRHLLALARDGRFKEQPLVLFLDEAHQFLNKELGDENSRYPLDSFELIAKEGRKFSLNICISTQRPRDVPEGVLSQMGTLIVHRLTNDKDREVVERASGEIDRSAAAFLPTLSTGQAVIIGVDFPMPLTVQVEKPKQKPDSRGPNYQKYWGKATDAVPAQAAKPVLIAKKKV